MPSILFPSLKLLQQGWRATMLQGKWFSSQPCVAEAAFEPTTCRSYKWFTRTISSPWDLLSNRRSLRASKLQNELEKHLTISLHVSDWKLFYTYSKSCWLSEVSRCLRGSHTPNTHHGMCKPKYHQNKVAVGIMGFNIRVIMMPRH